MSCMIWEGRDVKKVDLSVLDIGWTIIQKVSLFTNLDLLNLYSFMLAAVFGF